METTQLENGVTLNIALINDDFVKETKSIRLKKDNHTIIVTDYPNGIYEIIFKFNNLGNNIKVTKEAFPLVIPFLLEEIQIDHSLDEIFNELLNKAIKYLPIASPKEQA